ncbi:hypothetical protein P7F88_06295 [Vibrio hannami]|uniref:hypothetical protein n=1 Tax=Vibrio hannami TaxID=2717094 RepID=UPI002410B50E|nr:hypothetical protein [Vibrio hannami]MDG3085731.1 hypothetical protein [Vibrio hannami]
MNLDLIGYIITFASGIASLFIFLRLRTMYINRQEAQKKKELAILFSKLRSSNELLNGAKKLPFSKTLYFCLYQRQLHILDSILTLDPDNSPFANRAEYLREQIQLLKSSSSYADTSSFEAPSNEMQAIELIKLIKQFRVIIRTVRIKKIINITEFMHENTRLNNLQTQIVIGNLTKRANYALELDQKDLATELVRKGISYLESKSGIDSASTIAPLLEQLEALEEQLSDEFQFNKLLTTDSEEESNEEVDNESGVPPVEHFDDNFDKATLTSATEIPDSLTTTVEENNDDSIRYPP